MKKTEKLLFLSFLFLTSCGGNVTSDSDKTQVLTEKIVFGWGGTSGKYDTLVTQEIWKGSESKITPFSSHTGKVRSIGNDRYEFVGDDSYEKTFRPDDITCLARDNALVSFDASKTYHAFTSLNVKNSIDLIFLPES